MIHDQIFALGNHAGDSEHTRPWTRFVYARPQTALARILQIRYFTDNATAATDRSGTAALSLRKSGLLRSGARNQDKQTRHEQ
jgi:hypothetical protein